MKWKLGMGIHGEKWYYSKKMTPADEMVDEMMTRILAEQSYANKLKCSCFD